MTAETPWFSDASNFWRARAIFESSHRLDFLPDRGGFKEGEKTKARERFLRSVLSSREFKKWLAQQTMSSDDIFKAAGYGMEFRATNNRSHGYTYLLAYNQG